MSTTTAKDPLEEFAKEIRHIISHGDDSEAKRHLAAGRPIYYCDRAYPGQIIKEYPSGLRELIEDDMTDDDKVIRVLSE